MFYVYFAGVHLLQAHFGFSQLGNEDIFRNNDFYENGRIVRVIKSSRMRWV